ncbi:MAG: hypothetical protein DWQ37_14845 [Planctomycetota bacterium]|nr:MAG: hypothetical protein DWQ37_14845 [Planctomycetota bacterium]
MSADECAVYFGLRFEIPEGEIDAVEARTDPRMIAARDARLRRYWGSVADGDERYYLLVGAEIGVMGIDGKLDVELSRAGLEAIMDETTAKLKAASFEGEPKLYVQYFPDY